MGLPPVSLRSGSAGRGGNGRNPVAAGKMAFRRIGEDRRRAARARTGRGRPLRSRDRIPILRLLFPGLIHTENDALRQRKGGRRGHQFQRAHPVVELGLNEGPQFGNGDRCQAEAGERFFHPALFMAAEFGDLGGDLLHRALDRQLTDRTGLEGVAIAHQASDAHVIGVIDRP